ncbi:MAG: TonB-dependent receptor [Proteobacteria bacterium]|nr:TonB-dependent receptor [Pseudomonadota bacterium]
MSLDTGELVAGAEVSILETGQSTTSDETGEFVLAAMPGEVTIRISADGFQDWVQIIEAQPGATESLMVELIRGEVIVIVGIGSRTPRTIVSSPVPVDVFSKETIKEASHTETNQLLTAVAPSYHALHNTLADGTDHIDPISLRGLGPDQVLVLVNGKRRHPTALMNLNSRGRGSVGVDLNAIPTSAIKRIEVLRDGAAAQYGSDAVAGVINVVLNDDVDPLDLESTAGITASGDGEQVQASANIGRKLGRTGYINLTAEFLARGRTDRAGEHQGQIFPGITDAAETDMELERRGQTRKDYTMKLGQSEALVGTLIYNAKYPLLDNLSLYSFGGFVERHGRATGFYRYPYQTQRVDLTIYPEGFLPEINPLIRDWSTGLGIKGKARGWQGDLSVTYGGNSYQYFVENSVNASLGADSPTSFDAGRLQFSQVVVNADGIRDLEIKPFRALALVFGGEFRHENFQIHAGDRTSYIAGDETYTNSDGLELPKTPGSQVFPGYTPENEVSESRSNLAFYTGVESHITDKLTVDVAGRFERYSDFGNTLNGKLAGRYEVVDGIALRGAVSTGFRAPSLHQLWFSNVSTLYVTDPDTGETIATQVITASNQSEITKQFGIADLEEETSFHMSAGATAQILDNLTISADAYSISVDDRIVMTNLFRANPAAEEGSVDRQVAEILAPFPDVSRARFITNSLDTTSMGVDVVVSYSTEVGPAQLGLTASANFSDLTIDRVNLPSGVAEQFDIDDEEELQEIVISRSERGRWEFGVPRQKGTLGARLSWQGLTANARANYYGSTGTRNSFDEERDETFDPRVLFDLDVGYKYRSWEVHIGGNNVLNTFPEKYDNQANSIGGVVEYPVNAQFGPNGGFYYVRLQYHMQ